MEADSNVLRAYWQQTASDERRISAPSVWRHIWAAFVNSHVQVFCLRILEQRPVSTPVLLWSQTFSGCIEKVSVMLCVFDLPSETEQNRALRNAKWQHHFIACVSDVDLPFQCLCVKTVSFCLAAYCVVYFRPSEDESPNKHILFSPQLLAKNDRSLRPAEPSDEKLGHIHSVFFLIQFG